LTTWIVDRTVKLLTLWLPCCQTTYMNLVSMLTSSSEGNKHGLWATPFNHTIDLHFNIFEDIFVNTITAKSVTQCRIYILLNCQIFFWYI